MSLQHHFVFLIYHLVPDPIDILLWDFVFDYGLITDWHEFSHCFIQKHHKLACPHTGIYQSMSYSTVVKFALKKSSGRYIRRCNFPGQECHLASSLKNARQAWKMQGKMLCLLWDRHNKEALNLNCNGYKDCTLTLTESSQVL